MAKKRFPSPANQDKNAKPAAKAALGPLPEAVSASKQAVVQVEYKKENNHILGIGAHAIAKGVNTLSKAVWEEAQKHPSVKKLIADGHLVDLSSPAAVDADDSEEESEEESEAPVEKDPEQVGAGKGQE